MEDYTNIVKKIQSGLNSRNYTEVGKLNDNAYKKWIELMGKLGVELKINNLKNSNIQNEDVSFNKTDIKYNTPINIKYKGKAFRIDSRKYYEQYQSTWKCINYRRRKDIPENENKFCNATIKGIRKLIEDWNNTKDDGLGYKFRSIGFKLQSLRRILINYGCDETKLPEIKI